MEEIDTKICLNKINKRLKEYQKHYHKEKKQHKNFLSFFLYIV